MTQRTNEPAPSAAPMDGADPARLAALLDGRLSGAERDALLARLADDDEDLAIFAEAAAIQRELEAEDDGDAEDAEDTDPPVPDPRVIPLRRPEARPARGLDRRWMAAAAVLVGFAITPFAWRAAQGGALPEPRQVVAMMETPSRGLPGGWDTRPWPTSRGGGDGLSDDARAVRAGAYMVDLELAIRARDAAATRQLVADAQALMQNGSMGGMVSSSLAPIAAGAGGDPSELVPQLNEASATAAGLLDGERLALGAWLEAARVAAVHEDAQFFREARSRRTLSRADALVGDNEQARAALAGIRASLDSDPLAWPELGSRLDALMYAVA